jgi:Domain of unknown function (DUF4410)
MGKKMNLSQMTTAGSIWDHWMRWSVFVLIGLLSACTGTVQRDSSATGRVFSTNSIGSIHLVLAPEAQAVLKDNLGFNAVELQSTIQRRFEAMGTMKPNGTDKMLVTITGVRVRSTFSAVFWGFMAGQDSIDGTVQISTAEGKPLHQFNIRTSYALGGYLGGDATRMNWLYDRFSELAQVELSGGTVQAGSTSPHSVPLQPVSKTPAAVAPAALAAAPAANPPATTARSNGNNAVAAATASSAAVQASSEAQGNRKEALSEQSNLENFPSKNERAKLLYKDWLSKSLPRAFVVAGKGANFAFSSWSNKASNSNTSDDPTARAMERCQRAGHADCKVYAIDNDVVWKP